MVDFFGFGEFNKELIEGFLSWQHICFVSFFVVLAFGLGIFLGIKNRTKNDKEKNRVLIVAAIIIDTLEIMHTIFVCVKTGNPNMWLHYLPLFLCSIQLITIPLAAFTRGRLREAALDFVFIFGVIGALAGTYGAGNIYSVFPVFTYEVLHSTLTHTISGFCALYIGISGMASMKKKNIPIGFAIISVSCVLAYIVNKCIKTNYMFLESGEGTPYEIFRQLVNNDPVLYPLIVVSLFFICITAFYLIYYLATKKKATPEVKQ